MSNKPSSKSTTRIKVLCTLILLGILRTGRTIIYGGQIFRRTELKICGCRHGGGSVSKYLRQNLSSKKSSTAINFTNQTDVNTKGVEEGPISQQYSNAQSSIVASAIETAFDKVDNELGSISHWRFQGSTALAIAMHTKIFTVMMVTPPQLGTLWLPMLVIHVRYLAGVEQPLI
jgi:hypothetical protein